MGNFSIEDLGNRNAKTEKAKRPRLQLNAHEWNTENDWFAGKIRFFQLLVLLGNEKINEQ